MLGQGKACEGTARRWGRAADGWKAPQKGKKCLFAFDVPPVMGLNKSTRGASGHAERVCQQNNVQLNCLCRVQRRGTVPSLVFCGRVVRTALGGRRRARQGRARGRSPGGCGGGRGATNGSGSPAPGTPSRRAMRPLGRRGHALEPCKSGTGGRWRGEWAPTRREHRFWISY